MPIQTVRLAVDPAAPDPAVLERAAAILRAGGIVAIPTETVYGLAANAFDPNAVARIFAAKGRPARNPLIVHVPDKESARALVTEWPEVADQLADRFWPGPLSLVLPKRPTIPDIVTGGGSTVAIRCPAHPLAAQLLRVTGLPLAAPSANRSNHVSATTAAHVLDDLDGRIDAVLDGGPAGGGIESTVVHLGVTPPRLLRSGPIRAQELSTVLGQELTTQEASPDRAEADSSRGEPLASPGMLLRHYAPDVPLEVTSQPHHRIAAWLAQGLRVGALVSTADQLSATDQLAVVELPWSPVEYASRLYDALRWLEQQQVSRIVVARPPAGEEWSAIHDRLQRAAVHE